MVPSPVTLLPKTGSCGEGLESRLDPGAFELLMHVDKIEKLENFRKDLQQCDTNTVR